MVRTRRLFGSKHQEALLAALATCRVACTSAQASAPISGPIYQACGVVTNAIDDLAGALTGNRQHLWAPTHGTPRTRKSEQDKSGT
jgi:hypothetical protein